MERSNRRVSELEAKYTLFLLFGGWVRRLVRERGRFAAYIIGMVLAGTIGKDRILMSRLRTLQTPSLCPSTSFLAPSQR